MFDEWQAVWQLGLALVLSSAIGLERELRQKSAGLRTYTLVGVGSALFMLIGKNGFFDVANGTTVVLDPSRVAAQIVSGIGFIGAGIIFVRRDAVRGLTTAAGIWLTAAVGTAAGADLPVADGRGILRDVVGACTRNGFAIADLAVDRPDGGAHGGQLVTVLLEIHGTRPVAPLAAVIGTVAGVHDVRAGDVNELFD